MPHEYSYSKITGKENTCFVNFCEHGTTFTCLHILPANIDSNNPECLDTHTRTLVGILLLSGTKALSCHLKPFPAFPPAFPACLFMSRCSSPAKSIDGLLQVRTSAAGHPQRKDGALPHLVT